ncbi:MAG: RNA pseudouridine synthase [Planctomycetota bacterium]
MPRSYGPASLPTRDLPTGGVRVPDGLCVIHADHRYAVVDKPAGLLSVPGKTEPDCAAARVAGLFPDATGPLVVHRLDMDTSGLLVFGLDPGAQRRLSTEFENRRVEKTYLAIVGGPVRSETGTIDLPMRVDWPNRPRQIVDHADGKPSVTRYRVLAREPDRTLLALTPETGRTHQLRVHCAEGLGVPILGDPLYGSLDSAPRLLLHAWRLAFRPPGERRLRGFTSPASELFAPRLAPPA